ncbi:hypothetical protein IFR05_016229 [Cadophora sp. M221]|nr:hypothetical protein IFR05_016229 [Cadophora sp. M221]
MEPREAWKALAHPSEIGWNLPQTHERHILKFPQGSTIYASKVNRMLMRRVDIIHLILRYVLIVLNIAIDLVEDGDDENSLIPYEIHIPRTEKVTCGVLYGSLQPDLKIWKPNRYSKIKWDGFVGRPLGGRPSTDNEVGKERITIVMNAIKQRLQIEMTPDFVFCDNFLYLLHRIGPKNAAMLTTPPFSGAYMTDPYESQYEKSSDLNNNISQKLALYLRFILKFCPSVETLKLQIAPEFPQDSGSKLKEVIGREIRKMKNLKMLVVREGR